MTAWPVPVRIVGVGSPNGDDALAWEVIRKLRGLLEAQDGMELHAVEGGQRILDVLDGQGTLVLIDALAPAQQAGTISRFTWPDDRFEAMCPPSTHHLQPVEALKLAETLGLLPSRVEIFGIEAEQMNPTGGLSPPVAMAVPRLVNLILNELKIAVAADLKSA
jgi:hydrogenase maturation protease